MTVAGLQTELAGLTGEEFSRIGALVRRHFGLDLKQGKQALVAARLAGPLRRRGCASYSDYLESVAADSSGAALAELADALTTNFTSFLREPEHFDVLADALAPRFAAGQEVRIWSAASSSGEEAYSILFTLLERGGGAWPGSGRPAVEVLATDISRKALAAVEAATYAAEAVEALPPAWPRAYFLRGNGRWTGWYRVKPEFRRMVVSRRFNLIADAVPDARFAAIFCRNAMIYFDKPVQQQVVARLSAGLEHRGLFFIGHSESLTGVRHELEYLQPAVWRKTGSGACRK